MPRLMRVISIPKDHITPEVAAAIGRWKDVERGIIHRTIGVWLSTEDPLPDKENYYTYGLDEKENMWLME